MGYPSCVTGEGMSNLGFPADTTPSYRAERHTYVGARSRISRNKMDSVHRGDTSQYTLIFARVNAVYAHRPRSVGSLRSIESAPGGMTMTSSHSFP